MSISTTSIEKQVNAFCAQIGADPLLVQGAGGNVSWKDEGTLWVKASGTWLAEAELKKIFVPVNLSLLQTALSNRDFSVQPEVTSNSVLRPSIETLLHALMPHRVVVHLHAVEILAHLVQVNAKQKIKQLVGDVVKWGYVDYFKPGADLARAVSQQLISRSDADVVFLGNHGVVIGGDSVSFVVEIIYCLTNIFCTNNNDPPPEIQASKFIPSSLAETYTLCSDERLHQLALNEQLQSRLATDWALYPDHIVFLGQKAYLLQHNSPATDFAKITADSPPYVFVIGENLLERKTATKAQQAQLACYYDVLVRQNRQTPLASLTEREMFEILNWDAEKYRQSI